MKSLFTSESVTCGHPDKVCDQISDKILDCVLELDPHAHVACETTCTTDSVHVFGEISAENLDQLNIEDTVRSTIAKIGYTKPGTGFDADTCSIKVDIHKQSPDIARGIDRVRESEALDSGAGDQGIMFGFACEETPQLMPLPIELAHSLAKRLEEVRRSGEISQLLPDGKTQVSIEYEDNTPVRVDTIIVSAQHEDTIETEKLRKKIIDHVVLPVVPQHLIDAEHEVKIFVNPTGRFVIGGPAGDSGLTGRKIIADTYGGYARHGGGAFSGKDATKVDRSGAYMARYLAKNIVNAGMASKCEVQLGYSIGLADPVSLRVDTFGTERIEVEDIRNTILHSVDCRPAAIIERFNLRKPIFSKVACYGHFGINAIDMPWEKLDLDWKI